MSSLPSLGILSLLSAENITFYFEGLTSSPS